MTDDKKCLHCGNPIPKTIKKYSVTKYCCKRCKKRAGVARCYDKYKSNSEYMFKRSEDQKRIRRERKEKGLCSRCGGQKDFETTSECSDCYVSRKSRMG